MTVTNDTDDPNFTHTSEPAVNRLRWPRSLDPRGYLHHDPASTPGQASLLHPHALPAAREPLGMAGVIRVWERPASMTLAGFKALRPDQLQGALGNPKAVGYNMWTNAFFTALFNWLGNLAGAPPQALFLALGTGTLPAQGVQRVDTAMVTESIRKALTLAMAPSGDPVSTVFQYFSAAADAVSAITYTEAGLFSAASAGTMLTHAAFAYARSANVDLTITYTVPRTAT